MKNGFTWQGRELDLSDGVVSGKGKDKFQSSYQSSRLELPGRTVLHQDSWRNLQMMDLQNALWEYSLAPARMASSIST